MCNAFTELAEDDADEYKVCGCLHSFLACLFFQVFDFFAVVITLIVYFFVAKYEGVSRDVAVPLGALIISFAVFPCGPAGLLLQKGVPLIIYNVRIGVIIVYSIAWMAYALLVHATMGGIVVCVIWALAAIFYLWGLFVTTKAISYVNGHYRGYDDVDPALAQAFERDLKEKMEALKQKEIEVEEEEEERKKNTRETTGTTERLEKSEDGKKNVHSTETPGDQITVDRKTP